MNNNNEVQLQRLKHKLHAEMGPVLSEALKDSTVQEIMLNADGNLWVQHFGQPAVLSGTMSSVDAMAFMSSIASSLNTIISINESTLSGALSLLGGHRFFGWIPPATDGPSFSIRKKASQVFTLEHYVRQEIMSPEQQEKLQKAIKSHQNILVVGGTASGKTTLTNALIDQISQEHPHDRLIIIEDTREIQCSSANHLVLQTTPELSMQDHLYGALRGNPDRILVGEVRGAEALSLLKAWNTGHPGGIATIHANHAKAGLMRLESLIAEGGVTLGMPALIAESVDLVVFIEQSAESAAGRKITELMQVSGYATGEYQTQFL